MYMNIVNKDKNIADKEKIIKKQQEELLNVAKDKDKAKQNTKPNEKQKEKIEKTAQMILDSRAKYPNSSLADLYDELTMPPELRKAHQQNDIAVMEAYGFDWRNMTESDCVSKLMEMYQELINQESNN